MDYLKNKKRIPSQRASIKSVPEVPGVYIFWREDTPIYVGKAVNLKRRLESYFSSSLAEKTDKMMSLAQSISYIEVGSEIEALLLEARLVRKYMPQYNSALKDDKHPLYIVITKEEYPRVVTARKADLPPKNKNVFGPFPNSYNVKAVLRMLRNIFPFATHTIGKKACLYSQIGLCVPCPNDIEKMEPERKKEAKSEYLRNIKRINGILSGRIKSVRKSLEREMNNFSKDEKYEEAKNILEKVQRLDYITMPRLMVDRFVENPNLIEDVRAEELSGLKTLLAPFFPELVIRRVECFDIAHISGTFPTASMVTFAGTLPDKKMYRHFRINPIRGGNDVASLKEAAERRLKHLDDWGAPDLIIVDGGKTQSKVFFDTFKHTGIPVVGLAKRFETIVVPVENGGKMSYFAISPRGPALNLVRRIRDEAHRFARRYHHKLIAKTIKK